MAYNIIGLKFIFTEHLKPKVLRQIIIFIVRPLAQEYNYKCYVFILRLSCKKDETHLLYYNIVID